MFLAGAVLLITGLWMMMHHATGTADKHMKASAALSARHDRSYQQALAGYIMSLAGVAVIVNVLVRLKKPKTKSHSLTLDFTGNKNERKH